MTCGKIDRLFCSERINGDILKKIVSILLATVMMTSSVVMAFAKPIKKGDTNRDGKITAVDARNILLVVTGKKTIDDKIDETPTFIFKITDRFNSVRYEFLNFSENETAKEIVVCNIPLGDCTIEEVDVFRYETIGDTITQLTITKDKQLVTFNNKLVKSQYYTDTNYIKNHFVIGETMEAIR
jgi:hypothetical protein